LQESERTYPFAVDVRGRRTSYSGCGLSCGFEKCGLNLRHAHSISRERWVHAVRRTAACENTRVTPPRAEDRPGRKHPGSPWESSAEPRPGTPRAAALHGRKNRAAVAVSNSSLQLGSGGGPQAEDDERGYSALKEDLPARLREAEIVGYGFALPLQNAPNAPSFSANGAEVKEELVGVQSNERNGDGFGRSR
jgi:hypothetical protein